MELIGKQIAIETILGQPPELHYPSWYAAQIEKLPSAPPEYLAEQAGILVTDADTISRRVAISAICNACGKIDCDQVDKCEKLQLPPANNSEIPNSSDTISRQAAIDIVFEYAKGLFKHVGTPEDNVMYSYGRGLLLGIERDLKGLPPAQPKRGKWNRLDMDTLNCNKCGATFVLNQGSEKMHFCPNCGADMRGEQDDESRSNSNAQTDTRARGMGATDKSSGI